MKWEKRVVLGEVADISLGKMLDQKKNKGAYQPYLANINVRWGEFDLENLPQMRFMENETERYGLRYGDILVCEGGEPGRCALWKEQIPNMKYQKALHRVRVHDEVADCRWIFYRLLYAGFIGEFEQYFSGTTTIKHMPNEKIKKFAFSLPPLPTQTRIASILSAYDDLIENNQKQIKLLEEAAQRLYKEWFVDFKFPGHENVKIVDGVPEGWEYKNLSDIFKYVRGKSYTSKELSDKQGTLMINLKNIRAFGGYNRNYEKRYMGQYRREQELTPGDIVMGVTDMTKERRLVGHVARIPNLHEEMTYSMDIIKLVPKCVSNIFLYSTMNFGKFSQRISPLANGVNVLHLKPEYIMKLKMIVPSQNLIIKFDDILESILRKIELLEEQKENLTEARDRLLPKLMSGGIEV